MVLSQIQEGEERVIAYSSRRYNDAESRCCITRRELLAIVYGLRQCRQYLLGRKFIVRTDHAPLLWLYNTSEPIGQQGRWLDFLAECQFDIMHRPGLKHNNANALSRKPCRQCGLIDGEITEPPLARAMQTNAPRSQPQTEPNHCDTQNSIWGGTSVREAQLRDPHLRVVIRRRMMVPHQKISCGRRALKRRRTWPSGLC
jgi:RNase H-like domain found in reverse transcriptase